MPVPADAGFETFCSGIIYYRPFFACLFLGTDRQLATISLQGVAGKDRPGDIAEQGIDCHLGIVASRIRAVPAFIVVAAIV